MEYQFYDIINKHRPEHNNDTFSAKHPKMKRQDRAKIFAPFAALSGHAEQTHAQERITVERIELSQDAIDEINIVIQDIEEMLDYKQEVNVNVTYFVPDFERVDEGKYVTTNGNVHKIDVLEGRLFMDDLKISFSNIYKLSIT